ncbi:DUF2117 family protein [Methanocaldococcus fervens]|uniref:DUF2117 domain-containing protein n=1 Tax=Methanocaldococcus fervens (strain DSM 4213 / JCM 15782 / AG86) TaxID=573064 RepID=C7P6R2_METFA|nr:DUF2117 domain-containing protein [Methanocaldococcus fervens]ACV24244.1 conserved hypothetical protein [Methanocaldococcus fervens AG86]
MGLKIGVVVHGPEIVDSGYALKIINLLKKFGEVKAKLGGTMGRVAVIDNNLQDSIDISEKLMPSQSLKKLADNDILVLMNYGKSKITGHTFGKIVVKRANLNKPIIQIERPGEKDGTIIIWNDDGSEVVKEIANYLSKELNLKIERCISNGLEVWEENGRVFRKVHGVDVGEAILVNGIVVGRAKSNEVILVAENGKIVDIIGGELKEGGIEKLKDVDLKTAVIKTGVLRRHPTNPKIENKNIDKGYVVVVNHAGEDVIEKIKNKEVLAVITVGDDTTTICGDILARFGIKIIGITDGDRDDILKNPVILKGSVIFLIKNMRDDDVGKILEESLDFGKEYSYDELLNDIKKIFNEKNICYEEFVY